MDTSETDDEVQRIQRILTRERLAVDSFDSNRTTFLTHIGAQGRLVPGPWIAHRDFAPIEPLSDDCLAELIDQSGIQAAQ